MKSLTSSLDNTAKSICWLSSVNFHHGICKHGSLLWENIDFDKSKQLSTRKALCSRWMIFKREACLEIAPKGKCNDQSDATCNFVLTSFYDWNVPCCAYSTEIISWPYKPRSSSRYTKVFQCSLCQLFVNHRHKISMHSSRMRTARLLPVSPSMHCTGGGSASDLGRVSASGLGGLPLVPGGVSQHALGQTPPCEQNDWQTGVKTFAGGNNMFISNHTGWTLVIYVQQ